MYIVTYKYQNSIRSTYFIIAISLFAIFLLGSVVHMRLEDSFRWQDELYGDLLYIAILFIPLIRVYKSIRNIKRYQGSTLNLNYTNQTITFTNKNEDIIYNKSDIIRIEKSPKRIILKFKDGTKRNVSPDYTDFEYIASFFEGIPIKKMLF